MATADCCTIMGPAVMAHMVMPRPDAGLLMQLLLKASSNDKRFVVEEARTCLDRLACAAGLEALLEAGGMLVDHRSPKVVVVLPTRSPVECLSFCVKTHVLVPRTWLYAVCCGGKCLQRCTIHAHNLRCVAKWR